MALVFVLALLACQLVGVVVYFACVGVRDYFRLRRDRAP